MTLEQYVNDNRRRTLDELVELLRVPSVSTDPARAADVARCARLVEARLAEVGLSTRIYDTPGHPIVYGERLGREDQPTLLIYGHYDVQPPDPLARWRYGPFEPTLEEGRLIARGASDDKGQFYALVKGIEAARATYGDVPINVKVLIEGEEEIGSPNLAPFVHQSRALLASDVCLISDGAQFGPGQPAITYGLKGLCYLEMTLTGPQKDLHSGGFGGTVANPANVLARVIASCQAPDGTVTIPGFYDDVVPIDEDERARIAALPFDESVYLDEIGSPAATGEPGYSTLERRWARPTFDVNGLSSGFTGDGAKTVLPSTAMAKFSMRLVPDQDPDRIVRLVTAHLRRVTPESVTLDVKPFHTGRPILQPIDSEPVRAATRALEAAFGCAPVHVRDGGTIPVVATFREELGVDSLLLGLGQATDNAHSPNEQFDVDAFHRGQVMMGALLHELRRG